MPVEALERRVATMPGDPFYIHYDARLGSRIELSGVTFANWVDKTFNFLDTLGVDAEDRVRLEIARTDPGHWVTAVWLVACWQRGCEVTLDGDGVDLVVAGPEAVFAGVTTIACSLHPLGVGLPSVPEGCTDYAEVFSEPDMHMVEHREPDFPALEPGLTLADLAAMPARSSRALYADPVPGVDTIRDLLVAPLLGGGSTVIVTCGDEAAVEKIRSDERVG